MDNTNQNIGDIGRLAARIWGHRFREGQRGPEYVLEFLNVLTGTNYNFSEDSYTRKRSTGLRKFIFEGLKEGASRNIFVLEEEEKERLREVIQNDEDYRVLKTFLRNLEVSLYDTRGKEADRSWFARSLYPLHESLLYSELRKKDKKLEFERNFFSARGGELYFLMLMHGTEKYPDHREYIETRLKRLLTKNKVFGNVVTKILSAFKEEEKSERARLRSSNNEDKENDKIPFLPEEALVENINLFERFAIELKRLLSIDVDIYEMFHYMTSLVCFQLVRYFHERANINKEPLTYFIDCLDGSSKEVLRLSAYSFEQHENLIRSRIDHEFESRIDKILGSDKEIEKKLPEWKSNPDHFIKLIGLSHLHSRKKIIYSALERCQNASDVKVKLKDRIKEIISEQSRQHLLPVTKVMSRDGGFVTYRRGSASNYRYTISDIFLQTLVFSQVMPQEKIEYNSFLERIYNDYGIVIGEKQAKQSGLYEQSRLNIRYFQENERSLRRKLRNNGLLVEFSDATAIIQNPYRKYC